MRIELESSVGLVIDIQERLFPHMAAGDQLLGNTKKLLSGLKVLDLPIMLTEQYTKGLGPTLTEVLESMKDYQYQEKSSFSCCDDEGFSSRLAATKKKNVIICGIEAHVCVLQTSLDLLAGGYQPIVVADCVSSRKLQDKEIALRRMEQEGVIVSSYESILFELTRYSGTDTFKAISKIVK